MKSSEALMVHLYEMLLSHNIEQLDSNLSSALHSCLYYSEQAVVFSTPPSCSHTKLVCHLYDDVTLPDFIDKMVKEQTTLCSADNDILTFFTDVKNHPHHHHHHHLRSKQQHYSKFLGYMCCKGRKDRPNDMRKNVKVSVVYDDSTIICVIALLCSKRISEDQGHFELLVKQYTSQYKSLRMSDKGTCGHSLLIDLCEELQGRDLNQMQIKINDYMSQGTQSEWASLLLFNKNTQDLSTQVINESVLEEAVSISVKDTSIVKIASHNHSMALETLMKQMPPNCLRIFPHEITSHLILPLGVESPHLGLAVLLNKKNGASYTKEDERLLRTCFTIVQPLIFLSTSKMADENQALQHQLSVANELLAYHMKVPEEKIEEYVRKIHTGHPRMQFRTFSFIPRSIPVQSMPLEIMRMMDDLGMVSTFKLHKQTLFRFILTIQKGYRNPPYHNFSHAFAVVHFCYLLFTNTRVSSYLSDLEKFSLFIACLCHDIDHRGTTNSYLVASKSALAALYDCRGSVLESHHFSQTIAVLKSEGCNIVEGLSKENYSKFLKLVNEIILSTDIARHLQKEPKMQQVFKKGVDLSAPGNKDLLLSLLMTSCDLSDQTKSFENSKNIAGLIYTEFFNQGDLERQIGLEPCDMMDRTNARISEIQVGFLKKLALPVYDMLSRLFPETTEVNKRLEENCRLWVEAGVANPPITIDDICSSSQISTFKRVYSAASTAADAFGDYVSSHDKDYKSNNNSSINSVVNFGINSAVKSTYAALGESVSFLNKTSNIASNTPSTSNFKI